MFILVFFANLPRPYYIIDEYAYYAENDVKLRFQTLYNIILLLCICTVYLWNEEKRTGENVAKTDRILINHVLEYNINHYFVPFISVQYIEPIYLGTKLINSEKSVYKTHA